MYFPSPSSSILLTFTFPPLPRRMVGRPGAFPPRRRRRDVRSQCRRGMGDKSKPPYFPSARPISPDWIWRFWSSFSSFSWNYLELLEIKPSPNSIIYFISVFVWENHDYFIRDFFSPSSFFFSPGLLRYSPLDLHQHTNVHVGVCFWILCASLPSDCTWFWEELQIYNQGGLVWKSKRTDAFTFASYPDESAQGSKKCVSETHTLHYLALDWDTLGVFYHSVNLRRQLKSNTLLWRYWCSMI